MAKKNNHLSANTVVEQSSKWLGNVLVATLGIVF